MSEKSVLRFLSILFILTSLLFADSNSPFISLINLAGYQRTSIGFVLRDADSDSLLVSINGDSLYNPASVMKLVTGAAAFDLLTPQFQFKTSVYTDSTFDPDIGKLHNLYIKGGGDPGFTAERLWLFTMHLKHQGIKEITGDLILDNSYFDSATVGPGFKEDGSTRAYEAPVSALSANFNTIAVHIAPSSKVGLPIRITPFPELTNVKIISTAKTTAPNKKQGVRNGVTIITEKFDNKTVIAVFGNMAVNENSRYRYRKIYETDKYFGWVITDLLKKNGIKFKGSVISDVIPNEIIIKKPLYVFNSDPLEKVVHSMFKYSSNFAAEMVFKTMGAEKKGVPGTWRKGVLVEQEWWIKNKIFTTMPKISNGSGMGGGNGLSGNQITKLLCYMYKNIKSAPEYIRALSIAGVDGTVKSRFGKSPLKEIMRVKTGTLNSRGVSNLAGYIYLPNRTLVFAVFVNDKKHSQFSHWTIQQKLAEKSAKIFKN